MFRVLVSVTDKTGLPELIAELLVQFGGDLQVISTGGTYDLLKAKTKLEAQQLLQPKHITGTPEVMDGRVKTIHPKIAGGILARRHVASDMEQLENVLHGFPIDMVAVNLYPFEETATNSDVTFDELVEQIDIGGPSLIRAAAKNFRDVFVVVNPADYPSLANVLGKPREQTLRARYQLMIKAFGHTAEYDAAIADEMRFHTKISDGEVVRVARKLRSRS